MPLTSSPTASKKIGLFPGTFDPLTLGHLDIIRRGRNLFDSLIVAIGSNPVKRELFTAEERLDMVRTVLKSEGLDNATAEIYNGLTADYATEVHATAILRGLRNSTDLHHEFQLALTNRAVADIETVLILSGDSFAFTSSSLIKQIAAGGDIQRLHRLLPAVVIDRLAKKKRQLGDRFREIYADRLSE